MYSKTLYAGWADMDFNSHMRNTAYLDKAADVRQMFLMEHGFPVEEFFRLKIGPVVMKDEVEYFKEIGLQQQITMTYALAGHADDGSRFLLRHEVFRPDGKLSARVTSGGGWLDLKERRLIAPPPALLAAMNELERTEDFMVLLQASRREAETMAQVPMAHDEFGRMIEVGDVQGIRSALSTDPELANRTIRWYLNQPNESDPLHYVSDCFCHGTLTNGKEGEIAKLLLAHGALINGTQGRESPLIAAASLGAERVARVLVDSGAELESTALFGARALHWAAWTGASSTVQLLIERGARFEVKCSEFGATPLFWAVHGYGPHGSAAKLDQVGAARALIKAGAKVATSNKYGESALTAAQSCARPDMYELLRDGG